MRAEKAHLTCFHTIHVYIMMMTTRVEYLKPTVKNCVNVWLLFFYFVYNIAKYKSVLKYIL